MKKIISTPNHKNTHVSIPKTWIDSKQGNVSVLICELMLVVKGLAKILANYTTLLLKSMELNQGATILSATPINRRSLVTKPRDKTTNWKQYNKADDYHCLKIKCVSYVTHAIKLFCLYILP